MKKIYLIDTLGPFFLLKNHQENTVNWSKVHFLDLDSGKRLSQSTRKRIEHRFLKYVGQVERLGYNSLSIDDLAHLVIIEWYNPELRQLLRDYRSLYEKLFKIAEQKGMRTFINTDYLFFNQGIEARLRQTGTTSLQFFKQVLEQVLRDFPGIEGIILRFGETDGKDVHGTFLSRLMIQTPTQLNTLIKEVLPLFEAAEKLLIVRTWTVGAYPIGDLIWNQKTYDKAFGSIKSSALVISMKFGDTDFLRYLSLNPLLLSGQHQKIVELQTRREWEGMGTFPSFVGWDYGAYLRELKDNNSIIGVHVWCQTGGWAKQTWSNVTYLDNSSFWNELNTEVTVSIARYDTSVEEAVARFCKARDITEVQQFVELLKFSEIAIMKGVYIPDLARKTLYFRRTRLPPLLWLAWDKASLSPMAITVYRSLLPSNNTAIRDADKALEAAKRMIDIAKEIRLDAKVLDSLEFEFSTLELFRQIRCYIFGDLAANTLKNHIDRYQKNFPQHYSLPLPRFNSKVYRLSAWVIKLVIREKMPYRTFDKILLKTSPLQLRLARFILRVSKSRLGNQAMGLDILFK